MLLEKNKMVRNHQNHGGLNVQENGNDRLICHLWDLLAFGIWNKDLSTSHCLTKMGVNKHESFKAKQKRFTRKD